MVGAVGAVTAETGNRRHDETRVQGLQMGVAQAKLIEILVWQGFDQDIGGLNQLLEQVLAVGRCKVQGDAALVGMKVPEEETLFLIGLIVIEWSIGSRGTALGWLNGNDIGAQVSHHLCA